MQFTYDGYQRLLDLLKEQGYCFCSYHDYSDSPRCVILRHDIDQSLDKAITLAELEHEAGVRSTWFVLLGCDFYNPASKTSLEKIQHIAALGHEIGLHFDELAYSDDFVPVKDRILREAHILEEICGLPITAVSMHRPSKATLEADLNIPGMINSYGYTFFHDFKYLSDSRRRWREPVEEIVSSGAYERLHILTHAIWYNKEELDIASSVLAFVKEANIQRYNSMKENISDLGSILPEENIK